MANEHTSGEDVANRAQMVIATAVGSVCSDGNSNPYDLARDIIRALSSDDLAITPVTPDRKVLRVRSV